MLNTLTKSGVNREDVFALNVPAQRYQQLFGVAPPQNLGINLVALLSDRDTQKHEDWLAHRMYSVGMTLGALFEYDDFFAEFAPPNMAEYTITAYAQRVADDLLGFSPSTDVRMMCITASFFDAKQDPSDDETIGYAIASHVLGRIAEAADSYEPLDLKPLTLTSTSAAEFRRFVGNLYDSGRGVWCRDLVPFSLLMKVAVHTLLNEQPLVETLRIHQATGNIPPGRVSFP